VAKALQVDLMKTFGRHPRVSEEQKSMLTTLSLGDLLTAVEKARSNKAVFRDILPLIERKERNPGREDGDSLSRGRKR
jgi:hypothetical protein